MLGASWGYLGASLGPSWGHSVARTTQGPLGNARGAARETPSSITANGIKALPCHTPSTASAIHTTALSVPLPGRFSSIFRGKRVKTVGKRVFLFMSTFFGRSFLFKSVDKHRESICLCYNGLALICFYTIFITLPYFYLLLLTFT